MPRVRKSATPWFTTSSKSDSQSCTNPQQPGRSYNSDFSLNPPVRRPSHHAAVVGAEVPDAYIIGQDRHDDCAGFAIDNSETLFCPSAERNTSLLLSGDQLAPTLHTSCAPRSAKTPFDFVNTAR
jgi:hypothetical protein